MVGRSQPAPSQYPTRVTYTLSCPVTLNVQNTKTLNVFSERSEHSQPLRRLEGCTPPTVYRTPYAYTVRRTRIPYAVRAPHSAHIRRVCAGQRRDSIKAQRRPGEGSRTSRAIISFFVTALTLSHLCVVSLCGQVEVFIYWRW